MSEMNKSRRDAVKLMLGGLAAVPVLNLVGMTSVQAADLPHVDPAADPTAKALKYVHDSATATRGRGRARRLGRCRVCLGCRPSQQCIPYSRTECRGRARRR